MSTFAPSATDDQSSAIAPGSRPLLLFFALVFALSVPFWRVRTQTSLQLVEGLPITTLMVFCPLIAASILVYRESGLPGLTALLARAFDYRRVGAKVWFLPIVLLNPAVMIASYGVMRWREMPLPAPRVSVLTALVMFVVLFIFAVGEEVGWMGYAIDPMQGRWNALQAGVLLGLVWAVWHFVPLLQASRSLLWISGWCVSTLALRVLIVWLYNNTGRSVFATILFHTTSNLSTFLFPNGGSHYDPWVTGPILAIVATIVTILWGSHTLARYRFA
jgi:membrane protease YdiL (CAAX protease family)